ncbi:MAG: hypothetical protein HC769_37510 [Cyanobacteria bacterium CRU_2_1]|nr:hypothetical protein [Cyanobacteria bacterium CRU_2_1]
MPISPAIDNRNLTLTPVQFSRFIFRRIGAGSEMDHLWRIGGRLLRIIVIRL